MRNSGYIQAIKRPQHNMISMIIEQLRKSNQEGELTYSEDFIMGFSVALRCLANANGSFVERLRALLYRHI
jgi:hypothetical protein